jgi:DNA polymerase elongation subunit (family B)
MTVLNTPERILFLDIETVSQYPSFEALPSKWKPLWAKKSLRLQPDASPAETYHKASIYSEFGKIICICAGRYNRQKHTLSVVTFNHIDEKVLLTEFSSWINNTSNASTTLAAHNGREFDFPWIARRMLVHGISHPDILKIMGKKPWEINCLDTLDYWKCGDYKNFISLQLLAECMGLRSAKSTMEGSDIHEQYWVQQNHNGISRYCREDVEILAQIVLKWANMPELRKVILIGSPNQTVN